MTIEETNRQIDLLCKMFVITNHPDTKIEYQFNPEGMAPEWIFIITFGGPRWWFHIRYEDIVNLLEKDMFLVWLDNRIRDCKENTDELLSN